MAGATAGDAGCRLRRRRGCCPLLLGTLDGSGLTGIATGLLVGPASAITPGRCTFAADARCGPGAPRGPAALAVRPPAWGGSAGTGVAAGAGEGASAS